MKFLLISDQVDDRLYKFFNKESFKDVEFIISCGDLPRYYLDFLIDALNVPCFYVHGNHDQSFKNKPPLGWVCLDDRLIVHKGLRLMGFGGCRAYNHESPYQYTEMQMRYRYWKLQPQLWFKRQIDILVTHAPALGLGDLPNGLVHRGFKTFNHILDKHRPKLFVYGHAHINYGAKKELWYKNIHLVNASKLTTLDWNQYKTNQ